MAKIVIEQLAEFGQSIWLDNIGRSMIQTGELQKMIDLGLRGLTSNPTIFDNAIRQSDIYDEQIADLSRAGRSVSEICDELTIQDIQLAADQFLPVYEKTKRLDGYVSLEVNPTLAYKTEETIDEAKRIHTKVNRPNLMVKVPATPEGFPAIEALIATGININVTLIFSLAQYVNAVQAYIRGITKRVLEGKNDVSRIHSVASVFVSRIDTVVDKLLEEKAKKETDSHATKKINFLKGKTAVANSLLIYNKYQNIFSSEECGNFKERGAHVQRVLWGSTGAKNLAYSDIKYVSELMVPATVNTVPEITLNAFLDHGKVNNDHMPNIGQAKRVMEALGEIGLNVEEIQADLLKKGVGAFEGSFNSLLASIEKKKGG